MSGEVLGSVVSVKRSRKRHRCWWCGEAITISSPYVYWTWAEDGDLTRLKCHPECSDAWNYESDQEPYGVYECGPYEHERGKVIE